MSLLCSRYRAQSVVADLVHASVNLYRPFDDTFVGLWNDRSQTGCTAQWLGQLQQQLSDALPVYLSSTESQAVDLRCSQQWLK